MTKQMRASIQQASREYVQAQTQHLSGRVTKQDLNNAIKKVSKALEEVERARLRVKK